MLRKIWSIIIKSWDAFWESYEITYAYEYSIQIAEFEFLKPIIIPTEEQQCHQTQIKTHSQ